MQITLKDFTDVVDTRALHQVGLHAISRAHKIAVQQYCNKLTLRNACSGKCSTCALQIGKTVQDINTSTVKSVYGLYTWKLKDAVARTMDQQHQQKQQAVKLATNSLGERVEKDPFDLALEALNG